MYDSMDRESSQTVKHIVHTILAMLLFAVIFAPTEQKLDVMYGPKIGTIVSIVTAGNVTGAIVWFLDKFFSATCDRTDTNSSHFFRLSWVAVCGTAFAVGPFGALFVAFPVSRACYGSSHKGNQEGYMMSCYLGAAIQLMYVIGVVSDAKK